MLAANIQLWEQDYCATIYVPIIVNYWNKRYEKEGFRFKVFVFENNGSTRYRRAQDHDKAANLVVYIADELV
ncbi:C2H2-type domain-containing protein [Meloidogyne graminicola]|uniref:C2H2-type domain-containing protein n=1 Tax=Meloidogyne graminicola TaxID=189291 RepID=A0A8S9ZKE3_9BILA|nr:C2H2-type domain-containing protein [Meloidogyne graminicola]